MVSVTVFVNAILYYKVANASAAVTNVDDYSGSTRLLAATTHPLSKKNICCGYKGENFPGIICLLLLFFCGFSGNWQMLMNVAQHWKSLRERLLITVAFLFFRWNPHPPSSILKKGRGTSLLHIANQVQELCTVGTPSAVPPAWSATWDIFIPFLCFCLRFV